MNPFIHFLLYLHIAGGFLALTTGLLSMMNRKGQSRHLLTGKLFFLGMTIVFITATLIALAKNLAFLLMVGFFSYYLACTGYRVLSLRRLHRDQRAGWPDWGLAVTGIVAGAALMIYAVGWFQTRGNWGWVPLSFGLFCFLSALSDIRLFLKKPGSSRFRIYRHGIRMGGSFAAALTAFVVTNLHLGSLSWLLWLLPGLLTGIWIGRLVRPYRPEKSPALPS